MLFTIKQLLEGSKKVMGVWFAGEVVGQGPNNIPETSKVKQFNLEGILKILDRLDDKEDDKIGSTYLNEVELDALRKVYEHFELSTSQFDLDDITGFSKVFTLKLEDLLTRYNNASDAIKNDAKNDLNELSKVVSKRPKALDLSTPNKSTASYSRVREKHSMFENDTIILEGLDVTKLKELDEEKDDLKFVKALKEIGIFVKTVGEEFYRENYDQNEIDNLRKVIDGLLIKKGVDKGDDKETREAEPKAVKGVFGEVEGEDLEKSVSQREIDRVFRVHSMAYLKTFVEDKENHTKPKIEKLGYKYGNTESYTTNSTETKAVISKIEQYVNTQDTINSLVDDLNDNNLQDLLAIVTDFNRDGISRKKLAFYEQERYFTERNLKQFENFLSNYGYKDLDEFKKALKENYYTAREDLKQRLSFVANMRNRPNLAVAFTEKNAYPDFFNKVRERNKAIDDCDLEIDLKIDLNEDTIIKIKQALKDKLASEKNVYDKNFEINKYLGEQKEIIKKKVKEGREATEEWVNGNNKISNNLKDKGFVDALTNSTVQAMFSNVGFGLATNFDVRGFTNNLLSTAGFGVLSDGTMGLTLARQFSFDKTTINLGVTNFVPFISGTRTISEADFKKEDGEDKFNWLGVTRYSDNDVSIGASISTKLSTVSVGIQRITEQTQAGIERAKTQIKETYNTLLNNIKGGKTFEDSDFGIKLKKQKNLEEWKISKSFYENVSGLYKIIGEANFEEYKQALLDAFEADLYRNASKEGWNLSSVNIGLAFISNYFPIPFINVNFEKQSATFKEVKTNAPEVISVTEKQTNTVVNRTGIIDEAGKGIIDGAGSSELLEVEGIVSKLKFNKGSRYKVGEGVLNLTSDYDTRYKALKNVWIKLPWENLPGKKEKGIPKFNDNPSPEFKARLIDSISMNAKTSREAEGSIEHKIKIASDEEHLPTYAKMAGIELKELGTIVDNLKKELMGNKEVGLNGKFVKFGPINTTFVDISAPLWYGKRKESIRGLNTSVGNVQLPLDENDNPIKVEITGGDLTGFKKALEATENNKENKTKLLEILNQPKSEDNQESEKNEIGVFLSIDINGDLVFIVENKKTKTEIVPGETLPLAPSAGQVNTTKRAGVTAAYLRKRPDNDKPKEPDKPDEPSDDQSTSPKVDNEEPGVGEKPGVGEIPDDSSNLHTGKTDLNIGETDLNTGETDLSNGSEGKGRS